MTSDPLSVTAVVLTFNEAPNIGRTLKQLFWVKDIVVVDSFSDDETLEIANSFPTVRVFQREFDNHGAQWTFALNETEISTDWVLALDADFILSPELVGEMRSLKPASGTRGYLAAFTYCIHGRPLRSGILRPQIVLYQRAFSKYTQDGHTQKLALDGDVEALRSRIHHDDRKSLGRWLASQQRYMALEATKIAAANPASLSRADRVRRWRVVAPLAVMFYCLIVRRGVLDGWPGFYYALQRAFAESLLSLYLLDHDLNQGKRSGIRTEAATAAKSIGDEPTDAAG